VEKVEADYVGFFIPNVFVIGYGLDYAEKYRNLPFVGGPEAKDVSNARTADRRRAIGFRTYSQTPASHACPAAPE